MATLSVILPAAGRSRRFRDRAYKKPFAPLEGRAVWLHAAERFLNRSDVKQLIVVVGAEDREEFVRKFGANLAFMNVEWCVGGAERSDSIANALERVRDDAQYIAVHDAARPCVSDADIEAVVAAAVRDGAAILAHPVAGTLKRSNAAGKIVETVDRSQLWEAATPQVFRRDLLLKAYAARQGRTATDDAALVEAIGAAVTLVEGSRTNLKITAKDDLRLAEQILRARPRPKPQGTAHPFANDDLWR